LALLAFLVVGAGSLPAASPSVTAIDLGTLGGTESSATAVNEHGQVVGWSLIAGDAATHAFSWTKEGGMVDLGTLGGTDSLAVAVNDRGQVVGYTLGDTGFHAAVWRLNH
jgi:probable HAF family extracellular repeat protein